MRSVFPFMRLVFALMLASPAVLSGQVSPLQIEVNVGVGLPVQELSGEEGFEGEATSGATFGVHFALTTRSYLTWYVGFSQHRFGCEGGSCLTADDIVSTSWDVGARFNLVSGPVVPWLRVGVISHLAELDLSVEPPREGTTTVVRLESDRGWGLEGGAGLMITLGPRFALNPGIRYSRVTTGFGAPGDLAMRFLAVDVGVVLGF